MIIHNIMDDMYMNNDLEMFKKKYPKLLSKPHDFWIGTGLRNLFDNLCSKLDDKNVIITDVREKCGELRVSYYPGRNDINVLIYETTVLSRQICENCGPDNNVEQR